MSEPSGRRAAADVVGVRTPLSHAVSFYRSADTPLAVGDWVVVPDSDGRTLARVVIAPGQVLLWQPSADLETIDRRVEEGELALWEHLEVARGGHGATLDGARLIGGLGRGARAPRMPEPFADRDDASGLSFQELAARSLEDKAYKRAKALVPALGQRAKTPLGEGMVVATEPLRHLITVRLADGRDVGFSSAELQEAQASIGATVTRPEDREDTGPMTENM